MRNTTADPGSCKTPRLFMSTLLPLRSLDGISDGHGVFF